MGKSVVVFLVGVALLALAFPMFAPEPRVNDVKEAFRRMLDDEGQICLDHFRKTFVDPDSIRLVERKDNWVKIRAASRSGGFGLVNRACVTWGDQVNERDSEHLEVMALLDGQIACLKRLEQLRENGRGSGGERCSEESVKREVFGW